MATNNTIGLNIELPIYNSDGSSFHGLVLHKSTYDSVVMSLGDKITGDVYYPTNDLAVTTQEYVEYNGIKFLLVNHPTIVREGMASDNTQLKGMTKYSFVFYHPMYMLGNFPFTDVAVTSDETKYLSESKTFSWIGYPDDFFAKINKNLEGTEWIVEKSSRFPQDISNKLSQVLAFDKNTIADAVKRAYDEWGVPYIVSVVESTETAYAQGKRFKVVFGLPSNEIYEDATHESHGEPYVFRFGQGVGLKNNSRTPRNNKIITRIAGSGSEDNVPYGYPQIPWYGDGRWDYTEYQGATINYDADGHVTNTPKTTAYPLYMGIVGGAYVKLIKHPFTRKTLMPSAFSQTVFNKVSPYMPDGTANPNYNPNTTIVDYYDAVPSEEYPYPNPIVTTAPSYESHQFEDIKPELGDEEIEDAWPINDSDRQRADTWDDSIDEDGNYKQGYFVIKLPILSFDIYACAAITQEMQINMRGGACIGCTFTVQVDWDAYTRSFYDADGNFAPNGSQRDYVAFPNSKDGQIELIVQKDTTTFGTLMPNIYQTPEQGDTFVVLGISLPLSYITNAEERLDTEMKSYMLENNVHYFDYPLKFDENFLRANTNILSQIRPNSIIRFDYAGNILSLFVKQLTVKYGEGVLPKYDITLTDNIDVVLNQIGQVADDVERLSSIISILRQNYGKNVWFELSKKLSRVDDDVAYGNLRFRKNLTVDKNLDVAGNGSFDGDLRIGGKQTVNEIQSTEYTGDGMLDTGYRLWYQEGRAKLVIDDLVARGKFTVNELETRIWTYAGGNMVFSGAGSTLFFVEYLDASDNPLGYTYINQPWLLRGRALLAGGLAWSKRKAIQRELTEAEKAQVVKFRCYEFSDDGTMQTRNWWKPNDIAMCETLNKVRSKANSDGSYSGSASNTVYKRRVAGIGSKQIPMLNDGRIYDYVDLWNIYDLAGNSCKYKGTDGQEYLITDSVKGYDSSYHDWPAAGDVIVQMGNPLDTDRQAAVTIEVQGDVHGFKVYDTISDYSMANMLWVEIGYDQTTGKAKANVYGDFRFGCRESEEENGGSYVKYNRTTGQLDIKATINAQSTLGSKNLKSLIDEKSTTYHTWGEWVDSDNDNILKVDDLFIPDADTTQSGVTYKQGKIYRCTQVTPSIAFTQILYTDDSSLNGYINAILNGSGASGDAATAAAAQKAILDAIDGVTVVNGGLILSDMLVLRKYNGSGDVHDVSNYTTWSGISGIYDDSVSPVKGHGLAAWYGGAMVDIEDLTNYWTAQQIAAWEALSPVEKAASALVAKSADRFDGSGYRASGNISWDKDGVVTIKGQTIKTANFYLNDVDVTAQLNALFDMFEKDTTTISGTTLIKAKYSLYSVGDIQALGSSSGSGGGGGASVLYELNDVTPNSTHDGVYGAQDGYVLTYDGNSTHWKAAPAAQTYVLPQATSSTLGGVKIGYTPGTGETRNYAVVLDNDGKAYVNVPWENTWRPLGNGATDACAGNDSRLSDSRPASDVYSWAKAQNKPSYNLDEVSDGTTRKLSNYLPLGGGNMTGSITLKGSDLLLGTSNSSSNDSGDIVWYYGNGNEKARIWTDDSYAAAKGLNFRLYDSSGNNLVNTTLALASQLGSYLPTSGGTMSGAITFSQYGTSINFAGGESLDGYGNFYFGTNSQSWSVLNGSTHLLIVQKSTGNVGIGDANPAYKLEVGGNCRIATKLMVATTDQSNELNVGGNIGCNYLYASSDVQVTSDERRKDVIGNVQLSVEQIAQMPSVLFRWKKGFGDDLIHVGTIAQSWEKVLPAAVGIGTDDARTRSFSYSAAAYAMAHADALAICDLKKQKADACVIDALLRRISKLEAEIKKLKSA